MNTKTILRKFSFALVILMVALPVAAEPISIYLFDQLDQSNAEIRHQSAQALAAIEAPISDPIKVAREVIVLLETQWFPAQAASTISVLENDKVEFLQIRTQSL